MASAHFSLGFFSFLRGGGTGASPSFFATFFTTFFLGAASLGASAVVGVSGATGVSGVAGVVGVAGASLGVSAGSETEDSIWAAVVDLPLGLTPICASETAPTGGVGSSGFSTERRLSAGAGAGVAEAEAGGVGAETVGVASSPAMMACASAAASSSSESGVAGRSAAAGGASCSLPAGFLRSRSSATQPNPLYSLLGLDVALVSRSH